MTVVTASPAPPATPRRRPTLATALGALGALVVAPLLPAPALADAPTVQRGEYWDVSCAYGLPDGGAVYLYGSGTADGTEGGVGAFVEDADYRFVTEGYTDEVAFGDAFAVTLPLDDGSVVRLDAGVTAGEPQTLDVRERSGNGWTIGTVTETVLGVDTVAVTYDGRPLDLAGGSCSGTLLGFDVRSTEPAATIYRDRDFDSEICTVQGIADAEVRLSGVLPDLFVEVVADHGGADVEKAEGVLRLDGLAGSLDTEMRDYLTGEPTTWAGIAVSLVRTGRTIRTEEAFGGIVERVSHTPYRADVTVTLGDGRAGRVSCAAVASTTQVRIAPDSETSGE